MDKYNAEGYPDPTAAEALTNVEREEKAKSYRPCVFICSPFAGEIKINLENARKYLRFAVDSRLHTGRNRSLRFQPVCLHQLL